NAAYRIAVEEGRTYRLRFRFRSTTSIAAGRVSLLMSAYGNAPSTDIVVAATTVSNPANAWGTLETTYTVPAGVREIAPTIRVASNFTSAVDISDVSVALMADANLVVEGGIVGRHLNIVETLPDGAKFSLQPDGMRIWAAGNATANPNVLLTLAGGFRIQKNDGTALAWIDPATGALQTSGGVFTGGTVTGSRFEGGEIDIKTPDGAPVFSANESGGTFGGERTLYSSSTSRSTFPYDWPAAG